jgi:hypothetical protein
LYSPAIVTVRPTELFGDAGQYVPFPMQLDNVVQLII